MITHNAKMTVRAGIEFDPKTESVKVIYGDKDNRYENIIKMPQMFIENPELLTKVMARFMRDLSKGKIPHAPGTKIS